MQSTSRQAHGCEAPILDADSFFAPFRRLTNSGWCLVHPVGLGPPAAHPWAFVHARVLSCATSSMIRATRTFVRVDVAFRFRYRNV